LLVIPTAEETGGVLKHYHFVMTFVSTYDSTMRQTVVTCGTLTHVMT